MEKFPSRDSAMSVRIPQHSLPWTSVLPWLLALLLLAACGSPSRNNAPPRDLAAARQTVDKALALPVSASFRQQLDQSKAVFVVSPRSGGVALWHSPGTQEFSGPAFYAITRVNASTGSSTGFSRLPQDMEVMAAFVSARSLEWLKSPRLPGRGGMRLAAAAASPSELARADVVVLDLRRPQAANVDFDFALISIDAAANRNWYGTELAPADIFSRPAPQAGEAGALQHAIATLAHDGKP